SAALAEAEASRGVADVHALRIATKRLRYSIEMPRELGDQALAPVVKWLKHLQELLGRWHDRQNLHRLATEALGAPGVLLGEGESAGLVLAALEREHRADPAAIDAIFAAAHEAEARPVLERWLEETPAEDGTP